MRGYGLEERKGAIRRAHATAPVAEISAKMEAKWGAGRLVRLVPVELADRFGMVMEGLDRAEAENDADATCEFAARVVKGYQALDAWAMDHGKKPLADLQPEVREIEVDGERVAFVECLEEQAATAAQMAADGVWVLTWEQAARIAVGARKGALSAPESMRQNSPRMPAFDWKKGDDIPF